MTPKEVLDMAKENKAKVVDLRFMDYPGLWQHFSVPIRELEESSFEDGFGFDGSSIRGWQPIHASDMLVIPDPETAKMDPFYAAPTITLICNIVDPVTREPYTLGPDNSLTDARDLMAQHHVRHVPVVSSDGTIVDLVSHRDVLAASDSSVVGDGGPQGDPTTQTLDFVPVATT